MTGVEILATEEVAIAWGFCWLGFGLMLVLGTLVSYLAACGARYTDGVSSGIIVFCILTGFVLLLSTVLGVVGNGEPIEYETHYKVTISDEVPMNEFLEKYEIVDQDGKIFTVRERE